MMVTLLPALALQDWVPEGHASPVDWMAVIGQIGAWTLLGLFVYLLVRAVLARGRYRGVAVLGEVQRTELSTAIHAAEAHTTGEIVVCVLERSDRHPGADWKAAIFTLFAGTILLVAYMPWNNPGALIGIQLLLGGVGFACSRWLPDFQRRFVPGRRAAEVSEEQALQEFYGYGVHETENATGVLIFVSLLEHRVVVLGDSGIDAVVGSELWAEVDQAILSGIRAGDLCGALRQGIERCSGVLAQNFPWREGDRNELPNHVFVRAE